MRQHFLQTTSFVKFSPKIEAPKRQLRRGLICAGLSIHQVGGMKFALMCIVEICIDVYA